MVLPADLYDEILNNIQPSSGLQFDRDAFQTLLSLNLTSKNFGTVVGRHLFSTLVVDRDAWQLHLQERRWRERSAEEITSRINALIDLLTNEHSNLANSVRRLSIRVDRLRVVLREESNLHGLLRVLSLRAAGLNYLKLHICGFEHLSWNDLPYQTSDAIQSLCRSLPIRHLNLLYMTAIPSSIATIRNCPYLEWINLAQSRFGRNDANLNAVVSTLHAGHSKLLVCLPGHGRYRISYANNGQANIIDANVTVSSDEDPQRLNELLSNECLFDSLQSCSCSFTDNVNPASAFQGIDFGNLVLIRDLAFNLWLDCSDGYEIISNCLERIIDCIHHGDAKSKLEQLDISLFVHGDYTGRSTFWGVDYGSLRRLRMDHLLHKYPHMRKVAFRIEISLAWQGDPDQQMHVGVGTHYEAFKERVRAKLLDAISVDMPDYTPLDPNLLLPDIQVSVW